MQPHTIPFAPEARGQICLTDTLPTGADQVCTDGLKTGVGVSKGIPGDMRAAAATLSDDEREDHIFSCTQHMEAAYARFQRFGVAGDRDAAIEFMRMRDAAMLTRSEAVKARLQAEVDRRIDEGLDYFQTAGARARAELGGASRA